MMSTSAIDLDFVKQPVLTAIKLSWFGIACLLFTLLLGIVTWQSYLSKLAHLERQSKTLQQITQQSKLAPAPVKIAVNSVNPKDLVQIEQMVSALTAPWNELLEGIEQTDMPNIVLLSITPSLKKQQLLLTGEAKDLASVLHYVKQLELHPMLNQVYLQKHNIDMVNTAKPVSFSVNAQWKYTNGKDLNEPL